MNKEEFKRRWLEKLQKREVTPVYLLDMVNGGAFTEEEAKIIVDIVNDYLKVQKLKLELLKTEVELTEPSDRFSWSYIMSLKRPSRRFAKMYIDEGMWNVRWGDPMDYGVGVTRFRKWVELMEKYKKEGRLSRNDIAIVESIIKKHKHLLQ